MAFETHKAYFIAVCNLCGERSYPIEVERDADKARLEMGLRHELTAAGWGLDPDAAYCPGCWPAIRRKRAS